MTAKKATAPRKAAARKPKSDPNEHTIPVRLAYRLRFADANAKRWTEERDRIKKDIQAAMGEAEVLLDEAGERIAKWDHRKVSQFRQKDFVEAHPELAAEFTDLVPRRYFTVEPLPEDEQ